MKILLIALSALLLAGCVDRSATVNCENGFSGKVKIAYTGRDGTAIQLDDGSWVSYSPTVKCEVRRERR